MIIHWMKLGGSWTLTFKSRRPAKIVCCLGFHTLSHFEVDSSSVLICWKETDSEVSSHFKSCNQVCTCIQSTLHSMRAWWNSIGLVANTHAQHIDKLICQPASWVHNYNIIQSEVFSHKKLVFYSVATGFQTVKVHHQELDWMTHLELFILH